MLSLGVKSAWALGTLRHCREHRDGNGWSREWKNPQGRESEAWLPGGSRDREGQAETPPQTGVAGLAPAVATATPLLTSPCSRFHATLEQLEMDLTFVRPWCPAYFETTASAFFVSPA